MNDLNWSTEKRPLYYQNDKGEFVSIDSHVAVVRTDRDYVLGLVSNNFGLVQNDELMSLVAPFIEEGLLTLENSGYLANGKKIYIQAQLNEEFKVLGEDYRSYITLLNHHTGRGSLSIGVTTVRVICENSFALAGSLLTERYRHNWNIGEKIVESTTIRDYVNSRMGAFAEQMNQLQSIPCSVAEYVNYLERLFNKSQTEIKHLDDFTDIFVGKTGMGTLGRTRYDAFNSITEFVSHYSNSNDKFKYTNFGTGKRINEAALKLALAV
jgi:phage/plasmid-like protein (TIGR03299 family)